MAPKNPPRNTGVAKRGTHKPPVDRKSASSGRKTSSDCADPQSTQSSQSARATLFSASQARTQGHGGSDHQSEGSLPSSKSKKVDKPAAVISRRRAPSAPPQLAPRTPSASVRPAIPPRAAVPSEEPGSPVSSPLSDCSTEMVDRKCRWSPDWTILQNEQPAIPAARRKTRPSNGATALYKSNRGRADRDTRNWWDDIPSYRPEDFIGPAAQPASEPRALMGQVVENPQSR